MERTSFASIEQKIHQDINKKKFNFDEMKLDSAENNKLVSEIHPSNTTVLANN